MTAIDRRYPRHPFPLPGPAHTITATVTEIPTATPEPFPWWFVALTVLMVASFGFEIGVMTACVSFWQDPGVALFPWQMWALLGAASVSSLICALIWRARWKAVR